MYDLFSYLERTAHLSSLSSQKRVNNGLEGILMKPIQSLKSFKDYSIRVPAYLA